MLLRKIRLLFVGCLICLWTFSSQAAEWTMASGYPKSNIIEDPKDVIKKIPYSVLYVSNVNAPIVTVENNPAKTDFLILETGLGGRLDATNIIPKKNIKHNN